MPMKNPPAGRPAGAAATLGVDPEISQSSRSMLATLCQAEERVLRAAEGGRETAVPTRRYEGMDLDLKGGTTWREGGRGWKDRRLVEQLASRQWHSG